MSQNPCNTLRFAATGGRGSVRAAIWLGIFVLLAPLKFTCAQTATVAQGMQQFQAGKIKESIESFRAAEKQNPGVSPQLWQLGISLYYDQQFKSGQELFELHKTVNPNDVENATWHFICVAMQQDGNDAAAAGEQAIATARKSLIKINTDRDTRVPMREIYEFYAGRDSAESVLAAAKKSNRPSATMYAHLYLGLFYEAAKQPALARKHMRIAAATKLTGNYMHDVSKIHIKLREWDKSDSVTTGKATDVAEPAAEEAVQ